MLFSVARPVTLSTVETAPIAPPDESISIDLPTITGTVTL